MKLTYDETIDLLRPKAAAFRFPGEAVRFLETEGVEWANECAGCDPHLGALSDLVDDCRFADEFNSWREFTA